LQLRRVSMNNPQSPNPSKRRVGVYDRLGQSASASPAKTFGIGIAILAILIFLIVVLSRYW
jgi:hypothetical protein